MSDDAAQLINAFSALSPEERYAVVVELARISEADAGPVSDDELTVSGAELFSMYDAVEEGVAKPKPGETNSQTW